MFVIRTECKKALSFDEKVLTQEGEKVWVCEDNEGWVPATGIHSYNIPKDVKTFPTKDKAEKFIKTWKGHPWYYIPNGNYEIFEVEKKYKQVFDGYQIK